MPNPLPRASEPARTLDPTVVLVRRDVGEHPFLEPGDEELGATRNGPYERMANLFPFVPSEPKRTDT